MTAGAHLLTFFPVALCAQTIMKKLGIKSVPSFHLFKNGEQVAQWG